MKRVGSILLVVVGGALFLLGLLFVVGAAGKGVRFLIGGVGLASGAICVGLGIRLFKSADAWSPDQILAEILDLARKRNGEISEAEIYALLGRRAERAPPVMSKLVSARLCQRNAKDGSTWYVFKDLQPRLFVKRCQYCSNEVSIASELEKCPRCGGTFAKQVEAQSLSGGEYRMDE